MSKERPHAFYLLMLASLSAALGISACGARPSATATQGVAGMDVPLSEFILGRWQTVDAGGDTEFEVVFLERGQVQLRQLTGDRRYLMDATTAPYVFVDESSIHIFNPRVIGGEDWTLARSGDLLIVDERVADEIRVLFTRGSHRLSAYRWCRFGADAVEAGERLL